MKSTHLYLELMKKTLTYTLWPEPPTPVEASIATRAAPMRHLISLVSRLLRNRRLHLVSSVPVDATSKAEGRIWPTYADTMIGMKRLDNIQYAIETVLEDGVDGDLIEAGAWRGGACIFMRAVLAANGVENRKVLVADSFDGLPEPDEQYPADSNDIHHIYTYLAVSRDEVEHNFRKYGLLDDKVVFLQGWFKDTLPAAPVEKLSVLRVDADMYGSTLEALVHLYPKLSMGGFCIIDDYALNGCRQAVDDFRAERQIEAEIHEIDWTGIFWRKGFAGDPTGDAPSTTFLARDHAVASLDGCREHSFSRWEPNG
jgi:O-methyltransferase